MSRSEDREKGSRSKRVRKDYPRKVVALLIAVIGLGMAWATVAGRVKPEQTLTGCGIAVLAGAIGAATWDSRWIKPFFSHIKTLKIASFQVEVETLIAKVGKQTDDSDLEDPDEGTTARDRRLETTDIDILRLDLERKLAYVAKQLLPRNEGTVTHKPPIAYANVGSLNFDGYLTREQATLAMRIQTLSKADLLELPVASQAEFFRTASSLVNNLKYHVFSGLVKKLLKKMQLDTDPCDGSSGAVFVSIKGGHQRLLVWPSFATKPDSTIGNNAAKKASDAAGHGEIIIIAVPNQSRFEQLSVEAGRPRVVKLRDLEGFIREVNQADVRESSDGSPAPSEALVRQPQK
jgi:hypothetical protein